MTTFKYSPEKAQQALLYVSSRISKQRNMYWVLKALYFADIKHLHRFGRFIYGDSYVALQHGPVPSNAYNLVQNIRQSHATLSDDEKVDSLFTVRDGDTIEALVQADLSCFSKSDLLCLDEAIQECTPLSFTKLKALSHDDAYRKAGDNDFMSVESIASMSSQKDELLEYLASRHA